MKTKTLHYILGLFVFAASFTSCLKDDVTVKNYHYSDEEYNVIAQNLSLPQDLVDYTVDLPRHMRNLGMISPSISNSKATLGRVLFYDTKLSANNSVSCESCHHQNLAFSDDVDLSEGFDGQRTLRNSLALGSVANFESSYGSGNSFGQPQALFFWDERAHSISQQSTFTIEDDIEMGMDLNELVGKLNQEDYYRILFRKAYGDETVSASRITDALQEFVNSMLSVDSRFDEGMNNGLSVFHEFNNFSDQENIGKQLFIDNCGVCHGNDMSRNFETIANNGLDATYTDLGVGAITGHSFDNGKFKIPFLRNIALTGPYMHDGRLETLYDVVEHYSSGIQMSENLDFRLRDPYNPNEPLRMNFTDEEKQALVAFLETLTDNTFLTAEKFDNPFN
jgi:cytochrome c peroxidase